MFECWTQASDGVKLSFDEIVTLAVTPHVIPEGCALHMLLCLDQIAVKINEGFTDSFLWALNYYLSTQ